jgi:Xaa-Pro dipeptidase
MLFWIDERSSVIPNTSVARRDRVEHARSRIASLRDRYQGRALVLSSVGSVAWATGGLSIPIDRVASIDPIWVVVDDDATTLVASSVETPRLRAEYELDDLGFSIESAPWHEPDAHVRAVERLTGQLLKDCLGESAECGVNVAADLVTSRLSLCPSEIAAMSRLGEVAALAVEHAVRSWAPGRSTDYDVASDVQGELEQNGADAVCLIVGGDDRVRRFRHPIMVGSRVRELLMVVVVARCQGLHVALTRIATTSRDETLEASIRQAEVVNQRVLAASTKSTTWGEAYESLASAYREVGQPDAWREHFQGGPIGYAQREFELSPEATSSAWWSLPIGEDCAVAWNPSLAGGAKIEDTFIVDEARPRCVTDTGDWPRLGGDDSGAAVLVMQG